MKGIFITIEGPDGAGKTTVIEELTPKLQLMTRTKIVVTREPGGSPIAEKIRKIILDPRNDEMDNRTEALLYAASRRQHLIEKILPALNSNSIVLCDRFVDSSIAYQGAGRGIGMDLIQQLNEFATERVTPDLTLYLHVDSDTGLRRIQKDRPQGLDRLEYASPQFHQKVQHGYLKLAENEPDRIVKIDARQSLLEVVESCYEAIVQRFDDFF